MLVDSPFEYIDSVWQVWQTDGGCQLDGECVACPLLPAVCGLPTPPDWKTNDGVGGSHAQNPQQMQPELGEL